MKDLIGSKLKVVNIGLKSFGENLKQEDVDVVSINWAPRANGNKEMMELLDRYSKIVDSNQ